MCFSWGLICTYLYALHNVRGTYECLLYSECTMRELHYPSARRCRSTMWGSVSPIRHHMHTAHDARHMCAEYMNVHCPPLFPTTSASANGWRQQWAMHKGSVYPPLFSKYCMAAKLRYESIQHNIIFILW